jgi:hypothetical protein
MRKANTVSGPPARRRIWPWVLAAVLIGLLVLLFVAGWTAGVVPGQPEATRVPITPFADIPGFTAPTPVP